MPHIYNLKQHKISEEDRNLRYVLGTIRELGKATTIEIWRQVNKETKAYNQTLKDEAQQMYGSHDDMLYPYQIERYIKERKRSHLSLRTVQRTKKTLLEYSLIHKNGKCYSLSPKTSMEVRHFPHDFADYAAQTVFLLRVWTVEQSLEEMITRFGAYIFFTFIRGCFVLLLLLTLIIVIISVSSTEKNSWIHGFRMPYL